MMAATKEKKARDLNILKTLMNREDTLLVAGIKYQVRQRERARGPASQPTPGRKETTHYNAPYPLHTPVVPETGL